MTKKHFKILGLIAVFAWLAGIIFLFCPLYSYLSGTWSVIQILRNIGDPNGLLGFAYFVYGSSAILMLIAWLCMEEQDKNAASFFTLGAFIPILFPVIGMLLMNERLGCDYVGSVIFYVILQAVLLVFLFRKSSAQQNVLQ